MSAVAQIIRWEFDHFLHFRFSCFIVQHFVLLSASINKQQTHDTLLTRHQPVSCRDKSDAFYMFYNAVSLPASRLSLLITTRSSVGGGR